METQVTAGPVTIWKPGQRSVRTVPAYTREECNAIIRQGHERPRPLTHDESTRVAKAKQAAREDAVLYEVWARGMHGAQVYRPASRRRAAA